MKNVNYKIIMAILIPLVVLLAAFYWWELRPSMIRKDCFATATTITKFIVGSDDIYKWCLHEQGLE